MFMRRWYIWLCERPPQPTAVMGVEVPVPPALGLQAITITTIIITVDSSQLKVHSFSLDPLLYQKIMNQ